MKILFLCGREVSYPLNQVLLQAFRQYYQVDVLDENGSGKSILQRSLRVTWQAVPTLLSNQYDLVFVGFYGHLLMLPVHLLARCPVVFNPFISTWETLVDDRKKVEVGSLVAKLAFKLDQWSMRLATHILMDTKANVEYLSSTFSVPVSKFSIIFIGSDESKFFPRPTLPKDQVTVLYHGAYLPLQGIDIIIQAAKYLANQANIRFQMLGRGIEYNRIHSLVIEWGLENIEFLPSVTPDRLPEFIASADICLGGHFGTSKKAARVIAGKTFQDLAMGKPTIVGDNSANRELLTHLGDAWLCPMDDAVALAEAIRCLANDPVLRTRIGENAHRTFMERASIKVIHPQIKQMVEELVKRST